MRKLVFLLVILATFGCNKPKTVLICGDHVCINKDEAEQYFEDNLTLEVRIVHKKEEKQLDLVELNLRSNSKGDKEISIINKKATKKDIKTLSNDEIIKKKAEIKTRLKNKNKGNKNIQTFKQAKLKKKGDVSLTKDDLNKSDKKIPDICTILEECNIEAISKYLVKQGKERKYPDITRRENK